MARPALVFTFYIAAPIEKVWDGFVSKEANRTIFMGAEYAVDLRPGGAMTWSGPGKDGQVLQPEGLQASDMTAAQKELLLDLTSAWVNIIDDQTAAAKMAEVRKNIDKTYFLWSGDTTVSGKAYFRVQGPTVWIEYSPQTVGGPGSIGGRGGRGGGRGNFDADPNRQLDPTHVHTVYRDFTNDYGKALAPPF